MNGYLEEIATAFVVLYDGLGSTGFLWFSLVHVNSGESAQVVFVTV